MKVLVACEFSGVVRDAFAALGHDAWSCDLLPSERPGNHIIGDVCDLLHEEFGWDLMIAHPPCTRLCNSGVCRLHIAPPGRTLEEMWQEFEEGVQLYLALRDAPIPKKAIENPIMHCYARERIQPRFRQIVQPHWFGDPFSKATGFELIGLRPLRKTNPLRVPEKGTEEHKKWFGMYTEPRSKDRARNRSRTHPGIAAAMAAQWGKS